MTEGALALPPGLLGNAERYAVYRCYSGDGELLYIGSSGKLGRRLGSHAEKVWFQQVRGITLEWYADELSALNAERRAIHVEHPKYNIQHRKAGAQAAAKSGRSRRRSPQRPLAAPWPETEAQVLQILASEPDISGSELGRRLGRTDRYGRMVLERVARGGAG
jgi:hypothetical protein